MKFIYCFVCLFTLSFSADAQSLDDYIVNRNMGILTNGFAKIPDQDVFSYQQELNDFYSGINSTAVFSLEGKDTFLYLSRLLDLARGQDDDRCLLPFLKLYDKTAKEVYNYTCFMSSYKVPHKVYCLEFSVQFIILFVIQNSIVAPYTLSEDCRFNSIKLLKNESSVLCSNWPQDDYNAIYDLYQNWLVARFQKKQFDIPQPLSCSPYKWEIKTSDKVSDEYLKLYKEWRKGY